MENNIGKGYSCQAEHDYEFVQTLDKLRAKKESIKKPTEKAYITFSEKMIANIRPHSDPSKIDYNTGEVMNICSIKLPSKEYRTHQFGEDSNGVNRDERIATINVVQSFIRDNVDDKGKRLNYYTYLDASREYNINFRGKEIGEENGEKIYDKPEQVKLTGAELTKMFKESREISLHKRQDKTKEKETKAQEEKSKKTTDKPKAKKKEKAKKSEPSR